MVVPCESQKRKLMDPVQLLILNTATHGSASNSLRTENSGNASESNFICLTLRVPEWKIYGPRVSCELLKYF